LNDAFELSRTAITAQTFDIFLYFNYKIRRVKTEGLVL